MCSRFLILGPRGEVVGCEIVRALASILLVFGDGGVFFFFFFLNLSSSFRGFYQGKMELENV